MSAVAAPALPILAVERQLAHEVTEDGRERHYFARLADGRLVCECGQSRDRFGHVL